MNKRDGLRIQIEQERMILDQMLETGSIASVMEQSQKVDKLVLEYLETERN